MSMTKFGQRFAKMVLILGLILNLLLLIYGAHYIMFNEELFSYLGTKHSTTSSQPLNYNASDDDDLQVYRTGYHFQPPTNWMNDPNGPMYYKGIYHFFYQYNPKGAVWGNIVWAHSVSTDLINWNHLDPAIYPSDPFDVNGCWSGSATILPNGIPVILYTGMNPSNQQVQNIAYPKNPMDPFLTQWVKPKYNPVIAPTHLNGIDPSSFRDPTTAWKGGDGSWRVIVGGKQGDKTGIALLFKSKDFKTWIQSSHPLHETNGTGMWECPDFYPVSVNGSKGLDPSTIGDYVKHVLKVSLDDTKYEYYTIGEYLANEDKYVPDKTSMDGMDGLRYDYGKFYASKTFFDQGKNRRILWGWINESGSIEDDVKKGWAGIQAIPRKIWLDSNGRQLIQWPVKELESLRSQRVDIFNKEMKSGSLIEVYGVDAAQADVDVLFDLQNLEMAEELDPNKDDNNINNNAQDICSNRGSGYKMRGAAGHVGPFGLFVLASEDLKEHTAVYFLVFKTNSSTTYDANKYLIVMCSDQSM